MGETLTKGREKLRAGEYLRIDFLEGTRASVDGQLIDRPEKHPLEDSWLLEAEFSRLRSVVEFTTGEPMATEVCPIRLDASDGGTVAADVLGRRFYYLLDAIENTRSLFNDVADQQAVGFSERVYPAQVTHVQMDSPLELTVVIPVGVVGVLGLVYSILKAGPIAFKTVQEGRLTGAQARRERALATTTEIGNEFRRAVVAGAIREYLASEGAHVTRRTDISRLFDNALDQLVGNIEGMGREAVTGLELPATAGPLIESALEEETDDMPDREDDPPAS